MIACVPFDANINPNIIVQSDGLESTPANIETSNSSTPFGKMLPKKLVISTVDKENFAHIAATSVIAGTTDITRKKASDPGNTLIDGVISI